MCFHMLDKTETIVLAFLVSVAGHCYGRCGFGQASRVQQRGDAASGKRRGTALGKRVQLQASTRRRRSRVTKRRSGSGLRWRATKLRNSNRVMSCIHARPIGLRASTAKYKDCRTTKTGS